MPQDNEERRRERYETNKRYKVGKRSRQSSRARRRNWIPDDVDELEELENSDASRYERILWRKERARRQGRKTEVLVELKEEEEAYEELPAGPPISKRHAIVVEINTGWCRVNTERRSLICDIPAPSGERDVEAAGALRIGDEVIISTDEVDHAVIESVLPRRNVITRPELISSQLPAPVVVNADQLLIALTCQEGSLRFNLLDRFLIIAAQNKLAPVICINKIDLIPDVNACQAEMQPYVNLGYSVLFTSARTGQGVERLRNMLQGKITIVSGQAEAGKSSLLETVQPGLLALHAATGGAAGKARENGTGVMALLPLEIGGFVLETPGVDGLDLPGLQQHELAHFYPEIAALAKKCRFDDCSHTHEPGCAVKSAVQQNQISNRRYHNYKKIYAKLPV